MGGELSYFPRIYPGEMPQSALARLAFALDLPAPVTAYKMMGLGDAQWHRQRVLPPRLPEFAEALPSHHRQKSLAVLIDQHTLFPALTYFLDPEVRSRCRKYYESGTHHSQILSAFGTSRLYLSAESRAWRYCEECALEDREDFGRSYYHREHQFPGICVCWRHNRSLVSQCQQCHMISGSTGFPLAPRSRCTKGNHNTPTYLVPPGLPPFEAKRISIAIAHMCNQAPRLTPEAWTENMRKALIEQGLRRGGHLCYHALNQALARRYGGSLQKWLFDARGLSAAGFNWPRNVLNEPQYAKHPLLKVLLTLLVSDSIGAFESTALDSPIGQSSETAHQDRWAPEWVHALRLKADHGESAAAIARSLQVPLPEVRFFAARLGVIFLRKEPSAVLLKRSVDRVLAGASLNRERLRIKVSTDRLLNEVAKVDIEFAEQIRQKLHGDTQARYRALLETAVAELDSLTQIQGKHGTAFNWLGSHDREWLKEVTAPLRCRRAQNPPRNLPRTDDVQSAERVLLAAAEMQRLSDYPRITSTNLFDAAGLRSMVRKSPSRFPLTHEAILANVESTADFGRRQLTLVVAELAKSSRVIRRSAVLQRYQIPACLKASRDQIIREIVEAAGLQFVDE